MQGYCVYSLNESMAAHLVPARRRTLSDNSEMVQEMLGSSQKSSNEQQALDTYVQQSAKEKVGLFYTPRSV